MAGEVVDAKCKANETMTGSRAGAGTIIIGREPQHRSRNRNLMALLWAYMFYLVPLPYY